LRRELGFERIQVGDDGGRLVRLAAVELDAA